MSSLNYNKMINSGATLGGAWAGLFLHGAEQTNTENIPLAAKIFGGIGMVISIVFIGLFISVLIKLIEGKKMMKNGDIDKNKLSKLVKEYWEWMYGICITAMVMGTITLLITGLINEGFVQGGGGLLWSILFFGLLGTGVTLWLVSGFLIDLWPKTKKIKKTKEQEEEDDKLYKLFPADQVLGGVLTGLFTIPILTILFTELGNINEIIGEVVTNISEKRNQTY